MFWEPAQKQTVGRSSWSPTEPETIKERSVSVYIRAALGSDSARPTRSHPSSGPTMGNRASDESERSRRYLTALSEGDALENMTWNTDEERKPKRFTSHTTAVCSHLPRLARRRPLVSLITRITSHIILKKSALKMCKNRRVSTAWVCSAWGELKCLKIKIKCIKERSSVDESVWM